MSEECLCNIPVLIPSIPNTPSNQKEIPASGTTNYSLKNLQVGQSVQFLKVTILPSGKTSYKETIGKIVSVADEFVDVMDYIGDIVQSNIHSVKVLGSEQLSDKHLSFLSAV